MALAPLGLLDLLLELLRRSGSDASPPWESSIAACEAGEADECARERLITDAERLYRWPEIDLTERAALARYDDTTDKAGNIRKGAIKRTAFRPVDLSRRRVIIVLHQMGVERSATSSRWPLVTAHRVVGPDATIYKLHPITTRLVAANRLDRAPYHAISIEVAGNFEANDGRGDWFAPDTFGRGRASVAQVEACRQLVADLCTEVALAGARVDGIVPHRVSGRDRNGKPNRGACPGSRVWSEVGEWCGAELGLRVPSEGFRVGGDPVPAAWHGEHWARCARFL
jgi:hypothetical protein